MGGFEQERRLRGPPEWVQLVVAVPRVCAHAPLPGALATEHARLDWPPVEAQEVAERLLHSQGRSRGQTLQAEHAGGVAKTEQQREHGGAEQESHCGGGADNGQGSGIAGCGSFIGAAGNGKLRSMGNVADCWSGDV